MNVTDYKNILMHAIRNDANLNAWCKSTYDKETMVFVGVDEGKPPGKRDCPCVELYFPGKHTGSDVHEKQYEIGVICTISDDEKVNHSDVLIQEYVGVDRVELFRKLVQSIMILSLPGSVTAGELIVENPPVSAFPIFNSGMALTIKEKHLLGAGVDPFE